MASRKWGIGQHLAVLIAAVVIPLLSFVALLIWQFQNQERQRVERVALELAKRVTAFTDRKLAASLGAIQVLSLSRQIDEGNAEALYQQALEVKTLIGGEVIVKDSTGQQLVNTRLPFGSPLPSSLPDADREALETGRPYVSDIFIGTVARRPVVTLYAPVLREGQTKGLVLTGYDPAFFANVLSEQNLPQDWVVVITDRVGRIVARSRDHERYVGEMTGENIRQHAGLAEASWRGTTLDGVDVLSALHRSEFSNWRTVVGVPEAIVSAPSRQHLKWLIVVGIAAVGGSLIIGYWITRRMTQPLAGLAQSAVALGRSQRVTTPDSNVKEIATIAASIDRAGVDLQRHERANRSLIDELNHRVKNTLFSVQALANQTFLRVSDPKEFQAAFTGRLLALSKSHNALTESGWISADLRELVSKVCGPYCDAGRLKVSGEDINLPPRVALSLGLILHELCTNAAKYGALSNKGGAVQIIWRSAGGILHFSWLESGGPSVVQPTRRGFGSRYIESSIKEELGGTSVFKFLSGGLQFEADIPLPAIDPAAAQLSTAESLPLL